MCIHYIYPLIFKLKLQAFEPLNMTSVVSWEHHADLRGRNNSWKKCREHRFFERRPDVFPCGHFRSSAR